MAGNNSTVPGIGIGVPSTSVGLADGAKGPVGNPLVLYEVVGTATGLDPATGLGAYCSNSIVDAVLKIETTSVEALINPALLFTDAVLLMITAPALTGVIKDIIRTGAQIEAG
jgi:hypothetical protein